jgi:hypothetical protein
MFRYLFPRLRLRERLPLLPLEYSSRQSRYRLTRNPDIDLLKMAGVARTDHDALRLLKRNPGMPVGETIKQYKRKRRREGRLQKAWRRLKMIW